MHVAVERATRTANGNKTTGTILESTFHQSFPSSFDIEADSLLTAYESGNAPNHNWYLYQHLRVHEELKERLWCADEK
jgi:hypothetical protein